MSQVAAKKASLASTVRNLSATILSKVSTSSDSGFCSSFHLGIPKVAFFSFVTDHFFPRSRKCRGADLRGQGEPARENPADL